MSSDADHFWNEIAPKYRKGRGLHRMTPEEADAAFDEAPVVPLSKDEIRKIVEGVTSGELPEWEPPETEWTDDGEYGEVNEELLAMYREQGDVEPSTDAAEQELRDKMLSDKQDESEDDVDGGAASSGDGR